MHSFKKGYDVTDMKSLLNETSFHAKSKIKVNRENKKERQLIN